MPLIPHPKNAHFRWKDRPTKSLRLLKAAQIDAFNTNGFCLLENVIATETLSKLIPEADRAESAMTSSTITLEDQQTYVYDATEMSFAVNLVKQSKIVRDFIGSTLFQDITHDLLGDSIRLYWDQAVYKKSRSGGLFPWHQDNGYTFTEPQCYLTCWIPLNEANVENGCPWVIPKLHSKGTLLHENSERGLEVKGVETCDEVKSAQACPAKAGDIIIFSSLTPHKTGPNVSDATRKALIVQFIEDGTNLIAKDGSVRPQNDPLLNMMVLQNGRPPAS